MEAMPRPHAEKKRARAPWERGGGASFADVRWRGLFEDDDVFAMVVQTLPAVGSSRKIGAPQEPIRGQISPFSQGTLERVLSLERHDE